MRIRFLAKTMDRFPAEYLRQGHVIVAGEEIDCDDRFGKMIIAKYPADFAVVGDKEFQSGANKMYSKGVQFKSK